MNPENPKAFHDFIMAATAQMLFDRISDAAEQRPGSDIAARIKQIGEDLVEISRLLSAATFKIGTMDKRLAALEQRPAEAEE